MRVREFSSQFSGGGAREVEDAPAKMRQELVDLLFSIAEHNPADVPPEHIYYATGQSLGIQVSGVPYAGYRYATGRDVRGAEWPRIYDLIARFANDFEKQGLGREFRDGANRILAAYSTAWELDDEGRLYRILPGAAVEQVKTAFYELQDPRFEPALELFNAGRDAYDARPRRERDACSNMFDAMESVAKAKFQTPHATFGQVVSHVQNTNGMNPQIVGVLSALNTLRNNNFGHGMITPFMLTTAEVDFTYLSCVSGILLFVRLP